MSSESAERGIHEHIAGTVVAGAEHGVRLGAEDAGRHADGSPAEHEMERAVAALDDDARHARVLGPQDFHVDHLGRQARLTERAERRLRPALTRQVRADERREIGHVARMRGLSHAARTSRCRKAEA